MLCDAAKQSVIYGTGFRAGEKRHDRDERKYRRGYRERPACHSVPRCRQRLRRIHRKTGGEGQTEGGYKKADDAVSLNFLIVYKGGLLQFTKHAAPKVITPEANQDADAWKFGYRVLGLNDVKDNAQKGVYVSSAAAIPTAAASEGDA